MVGWLEALQGQLLSPQDEYQAQAGGSSPPLSLAVAVLGGQSVQGQPVRDRVREMLLALGEDVDAVQYLIDSTRSLYEQQSQQKEERGRKGGAQRMQEVIAGAMLPPPPTATTTTNVGETEKETAHRLECISSLQALFPDNGEAALPAWTPSTGTWSAPWTPF